MEHLEWAFRACAFFIMARVIYRKGVADERLKLCEHAVHIVLTPGLPDRDYARAELIFKKVFNIKECSCGCCPAQTSPS